MKKINQRIRGVDLQDRTYISFPVKFVPEVSEGSVFGDTIDSNYGLVVTSKFEEDLKKTLKKHFQKRQIASGQKDKANTQL